MDKKQVASVYPWGNPVRKKVIPHLDIVSYYDKDVVKKVGEKEDDFVIQKVCTEYERLNRADYIKSHQNDVGVKNMIKKSLRNGESLDYVMSEKFKSPQDGFVDTIAIEEALSDPDAFAKKTINAYKKMPKDLKKGKSAHDLSKMTETEINAYVKSLVDAQIKAKLGATGKSAASEAADEKKEGK